MVDCAQPSVSALVVDRGFLSTRFFNASLSTVDGRPAAPGEPSKNWASGSDHIPILIDVEVDREGRRERRITSWAWRKAKWQEFRQELEERVNRMTTMMLEVAKKWIPKKRLACRNRPFWDAELGELRRMRDALREDPERIGEWREKNEELKEKKKEYWKKFVENLREKDAKKVWKTVKSLSTGNKVEAPNEILNVDGREARTDLQKAKCFMDQYAAVRGLKLGKEERKKRVEVKNRLRRYAREEDEFGREFLMGELEGALEQLNEWRKGGDDGVETAMLKRMGEGAKKMWLRIFNISWAEGRCAGSWKKVVIIPILKMGKDPKERASYRPVSLTSVCVKLMEKMVVNRLYYWMEKNDTSQMAGRVPEGEEHRRASHQDGAGDSRWV